MQVIGIYYAFIHGLNRLHGRSLVIYILIVNIRKAESFQYL